MAYASLQTPDMLNSPQLGAVSGGMSRGPRYEDYIDSSAAMLPQIEEAQYQRDMQEEGMRLDREARQQAARDSNIALRIKGTETAVKLGMNPTIQKWGKGVWNALQPKPSVTSLPGASDLIPKVGDPLLTDAGGSAFNNAAGAYDALDSGGMSDAGYGTMNGVTSTTPVLTNTAIENGGNMFNSLSNKFGKAGILGKANMITGPTVGAFSLGHDVAGGSMPGNIRSLIPSMGKNESKILSGVGAGALSGFVASGFNPIGAIVGGIFGGMGSKNKCVIVTAATSPDSMEVELARDFRDRFVDRTTLRGYYMTASWLVPAMENDDTVKALVKEHLVDSLTRYASWKLGHTREHPSNSDCATVRNFLSYCRDLGSTVKEFVREDGEVI